MGNDQGFAVLHPVDDVTSPAPGFQPKGTVATLAARIPVETAKPARQFVAHHQDALRLMGENSDNRLRRRIADADAGPLGP